MMSRTSIGSRLRSLVAVTARTPRPQRNWIRAMN